MITYLTGDATNPVGDGVKIIAHICNDIGAWGAGFVLAVSRKSPEPRASYLLWSEMLDEETIPFRLGRMKLVDIGDGIYVANMIAQDGCGWDNGKPPIRYNALEDCLAELVLHAKVLKASVHMPRIGCGLAGGTWDQIEPLIEKHLVDVSVMVYDLPEGERR